jgi:flagellar biosynthetic protein FliO
VKNEIFFNGKTSSNPETLHLVAVTGLAGKATQAAKMGAIWRRVPCWSPFPFSCSLPAAVQQPKALMADNSPTNSLIMVFDVMIKLSVVVVLIFLSAIVYRRWQGKPAVSGQKQLTLLETLPLGPKRVLHVVKAGDQTLLIGATDQSIQLISTLKSSGQSELANNAPQAQAVSFASLLDSAQNQPQEPLP